MRFPTSRGHRIAFDVQGRGPADDLPAVLDACGVEHALVVGYAMGDWIACAFAARRAARLLSVTVGGAPAAAPSRRSPRALASHLENAAFVAFPGDHPGAMRTHAGASLEALRAQRRRTVGSGARAGARAGPRSYSMPKRRIFL